MPDTLAERTPPLLAATGLGMAALVVLVVAGAPLNTDDLWWHLTAGETFAALGPWPGADPSLHTAHADAPLPHEWLFGILVHLVNARLGFFGLRGLHAAAVLAIGLLAYSVGYRESGRSVAAGLITGLFLVLASGRLAQLRPDLISIPATLLVYRIVLERGRRPSWPRIAAAAAVTGAWANFHSLFLLGPIFVATALAATAGQGLALRVLARGGRAAATVAEDRRTLRRLAAAVVVMLLASVVNPQGPDQLRFLLVAAGHTDIWAVGDEWSRFAPFAYAANNPAVTWAQWVSADAVLVGFAAAAAFALARFARHPAEGTLRAAAPVLLGLSVASIVALLVSIRFLWLALFPMLYTVRVLAGARPRRRGVRTAAVWVMAVGVIAAAAAVARALPALDLAGRFIDRPRAYLTTPYRTQKYHVEGVRFLRETGLEGNLYNPYWMGGFLGYWLAPRLRTFIDGRTVDVPRDVIADHFAVRNFRGGAPGETLLDTLDRRRVDIFFGVGYPGHRYPDYTTTHLERTPGWLLVSRSYRHAIYVRRNARNRENIRRVAAFYARRGIPFDERDGLDPNAVIAAPAAWAADRFLVPASYRVLRARTADPDPGVQRTARDTLAVVYLLAGAYAKQVALDRDTAARFPRAKGPRRRLVYGLLRLDRPREALAAARRLLEIDARDWWSVRMLQTASDYAEIDRTEAAPRRRRVRLNALLWQEFPATTGETRRVEALMGSERLRMAGPRAGRGLRGSVSPGHLEMLPPRGKAARQEALAKTQSTQRERRVDDGERDPEADG